MSQYAPKHVATGTLRFPYFIFKMLKTNDTLKYDTVEKETYWASKAETYAPL